MYQKYLKLSQRIIIIKMILNHCPKINTRTTGTTLKKHDMILLYQKYLKFLYVDNHKSHQDHLKIKADITKYLKCLHRQNHQIHFGIYLDNYGIKTIPYKFNSEPEV